MVTVKVFGNVIRERENPWVKYNTGFGRKPTVWMNITGRRYLLEKHPAVVARWEKFKAVRPQASAQCANFKGPEKMACIARTMSTLLKGK
jgi:hypothetical protein